MPAGRKDGGGVAGKGRLGWMLEISWNLIMHQLYCLMTCI